MRRWNFQQVVIGMVVAICCMLVGASVLTTNQAHGEVRGTPEPQQFQSGSVPLLREISGTLRQMDARLARLEVVAQKLQKSAASRAASARATEENN
jgi:hypothetical protein